MTQCEIRLAKVRHLSQIKELMAFLVEVPA
jgi:hypothetical protein